MTYAAYPDDTLRELRSGGDEFRREILEVIEPQSDYDLSGAARWKPGEGWMEVNSDNEPLNDHVSRLMGAP